ncbi:MAG: cytochrome c maturation protein CcmE [Gemmatimonadota bacterium]
MPQSTDPRGRRRAFGVLGVLVLVAAFAYLMFGRLEENVVFFLTPAELIERGDRVVEVPVRLGGLVEPGSVKWNAATLELSFRVQDSTGTGASAVPVHSRGAPPQMFRDGMGVVVEGRYRRDGVFESSSLMIKHSEEYRAPAPGQRPQEMYRSLIKSGGSAS